MIQSIKNLIDRLPETQAKTLTEYYSILTYTSTARGNFSPNSLRLHIQAISHFLLYYCPNWTDFNRKNIQLYVNDLVRRSMLVGIYKRFATFLLDQKLLPEDLQTQILNLDIKDKPRKQNQKYSIPQSRWTEIYRHPHISKDYSRRFTMWFGFNFGLRAGELLHFTEDDLFLDRNFLEIQTRDHSDDWEPKTLSSNRRLFIHKKQKLIFEKYLKIRQNPKSKYLIYNRRSKHQNLPMKYNALFKWFRPIELEFQEKGKTVLRRFRPHILRYSSAVYYYESTKDLYAVSKFLGHSSMKQTEEYLGLTEQQRYDRIQGMMLNAWN